MIDLAPPPLILPAPAIIHSIAEPWERKLSNWLMWRGVPLAARLSVLAEMRRVLDAPLLHREPLVIDLLRHGPLLGLGVTPQVLLAGYHTAGHRYWRIYISTWTSVGFHIVGEVEFRVTGVDQVPTLTGYTSGNVTVSADSEESSSNPAWHAFDGSAADDHTWWNNYTTTGWLKADFGSAGPWPMLDAVAIAPRSTSGQSYIFSAFSVDWSDDNSAWTTVHSWSGLTTGWSAGTLRVFTL